MCLVLVFVVVCVVYFVFSGFSFCCGGHPSSWKRGLQFERVIARTTESNEYANTKNFQNSGEEAAKKMRSDIWDKMTAKRIRDMAGVAEEHLMNDNEDDNDGYDDDDDGDDEVYDDHVDVCMK